MGSLYRARRPGTLQSLTSYYDPVEKFHYSPGGPASGASTAFMILPQNREMGALLYDATATNGVLGPAEILEAE